MKIAKIIATSFYFSEHREETTLAGNPPTYSFHSQKFLKTDDVKNLIMFQIEQEKKCNPGFPVDLIFVNNDVGNKEGNKFIQNLNNYKFNNGKVITIQNDNFGWSFGAYNKGYKELRNLYDYFIFTEHDVIISRDGYAKKSLDDFKKNKNCGFISYWGISYYDGYPRHINKDDYTHAKGASGFTSNEVLDKVFQKYGSLPYSKSSEKKDYRKIIEDGEIKFTNVIIKLGYKLYESSEKTFDSAYDLMRGIKKPWKPSQYELLKWNLKKN